MSDREDDENLLRNEETLRRRAWIDRAIHSVRRRLEMPERRDVDVHAPRRSAPLFLIRPRKPR